MSQEERYVREQLGDLLQKGHAHMSFEDAVADFPKDLINIYPPNVEYTFWHILEHIQITQKDILDFIAAPKYKELKWPQDYWPDKNAKATEQDWKKTITQYLEDRKALEKLVEDPKTNLYIKISRGTGQTILQEIFTIADHTAYHVGEFAILRQVCNGWVK